MNPKPLIITFAGVPGCGKTPVAFRLSQIFYLPIFSNDVLRTEIHEDSLDTVLDLERLESLRDERLDVLLKRQLSFIYDSSVDRRFHEMHERAEKNGFDELVISFDLSDGFLQKLWDAKGYKWPDATIDRWRHEHTSFLSSYASNVNLSITDDNYSERQGLAEEIVRTFISQA